MSGLGAPGDLPRQPVEDPRVDRVKPVPVKQAAQPLGKESRGLLQFGCCRRPSPTPGTGARRAPAASSPPSGGPAAPAPAPPPARNPARRRPAARRDDGVPGATPRPPAGGPPCRVSATSSCHRYHPRSPPMPVNTPVHLPGGRGHLPRAAFEDHPFVGFHAREGVGRSGSAMGVAPGGLDAPAFQVLDHRRDGARVVPGRDCREQLPGQMVGHHHLVPEPFD